MKTSVLRRAVCLCTIMVAAVCLTGCKHRTAAKPSEPSIQVTAGTLLQEMVDRDAAARYPDPAYASASFSSYDRTSLSKTENWFGNGDNNWFLRHETVDEREEFVLFDTDGPGAITRWWMTFAGAKGGSGIMRIYIDNAEEPAVTANPFNLLSGDSITIEPISSSVSQLTELEHRGLNLFYPIPYSTHCKITYSSDYIQPSGDRQIAGDECVYYNIEYRTYAPGTTVESYSAENAAKYSDLEAAAAAALSNPGEIAKSSRHSLDCTLEPGASFELKLKGPSAIREIAMQLAAEDINQALRSTVLEIAFDGESTVFIPVGEFFGVGYKPLYTRMWYVDANEDCTMSARWVMPFCQNATLKLTNHGSQAVTVQDAHASVSDWNFDARTMYFHATWKFYPKLDTRIDPVTGEACEHYDINYVTLAGKGVYMGTSMSIFDLSSGWWGEGDEKVYVDGATFPSFFGTGSEDFFGYAWCHPNTIVDHPFTSQPCGTGNLAPGYSFNSRLRSLDGICFAENLVFDMEMWHWNHSVMDLGVSNYFYLLPGGTVQNERDTTGITAKPVLDVLELLELDEDKMDIEAEFLRLDTISGGNHEAQSAFGEKWSNGAQLFWNKVPAGSDIEVSFDSPYEGEYILKLLYAFSWDYGYIDVWFNDTQLESARCFNNPEIKTEWSEYGPVQVVAGRNAIKLHAVEPFTGNELCFFGLDRLILEKVK
ncbi:MAG: DUF2961 domain-containing protein [Bacteroidales bacterium]|nr:DUF2961 domain-containing protein [Candidatus Equibacterium intestinale]